MLLELQQLRFSFSKNKPLFEDISLAIDEGKIFALMGGNGVGKTTLFNIICGFHKPTDGHVLFKKQKIGFLPTFKRNHLGIGRSFQDNRLVPTLTVAENIKISYRGKPEEGLLDSLRYNLKRFESVIAQEYLESICQKFHLTEIMHTAASAISYGQQKLLLLACCYANSPSIMLLDEPVAGVQPTTRDAIKEIIKDLKSEGKTFLIIEHNVDFIDNLVDGIFFLKADKVLFFKTINELRSNAEVRSAYF